MLVDGSIDTELDEQSVIDALDAMRAQGVQSIAVVLINSYANPVREVRVEQVLREAGFAGVVSLSHLVVGEYGEYERLTTTVVDALVRLAVSSYLERLEGDLQSRGFDGGAWSRDQAAVRSRSVKRRTAPSRP